MKICGEIISRLLQHDLVHLPHALLACHDCFCYNIQYLVVVLHINDAATIYRNKRNNFLPKTKILVRVLLQSADFFF